VDGSEPHVSAHLSYFQAELVRPTPLGSTVALPSDAPCDATNCDENFFTKRRLENKESASKAKPMGIWTRLQTAVKTCPSDIANKYSAPMGLSDLLIAYYFRSLQTNMHVHTCVIGYCKRALGEACRWDLPATSTNMTQRLDTESNRVLPIRRHLPDDRWLKVHSLPILIRTLSNVQTNLHHPDASNNCMCYPLKYISKDEPRTRIQISEYGSHAAVDYLDTQFISLPMAAADVLGNKVTWASRKTTLTIPGWNENAGNLEWRLYIQRIPYNLDWNPALIQPTISAEAIQHTLRMLRMQQLARYFPLHASSSDDSIREQNSDDEAAEISPSAKRPKFGTNVDKFLDKPSHPHFDPVLSLLHEGATLTLPTTQRHVILRRQNDEKLTFCRFFHFPPTLKMDHLRRTERSKSFEIRLFQNLNWHPWPCTLPRNYPRIVSYLPQGLQLKFTEFDDLLEFWRTPDGIAFALHHSMIDISEESANSRYSAIESICCKLEAAFTTSNRVCQCCMRIQQGLHDGCQWCLNATGWHRCQHDIIDSSSWTNTSLWKWKPRTLWAHGSEDTRAYVIQLMHQAYSVDFILKHLQSMRILYEKDLICSIII